MRIISGIAGSRKIRVPGSVARPSTDRLREALFSILGPRVQDARVLDLFAGSGALGLESLSRGARSCVFVDDSKQSQQVIAGNLKDLELTGGRVHAGDVFRMLSNEPGEYELVFADPPYCKSPGEVDYVEQLLVDPSLPQRLSAGGVLVIEDAGGNQRDAYEGWDMIDKRSYGGSAILFYQAQTNR